MLEGVSSDRRKLQLLGGTTLSVSVPKTWAKAMGLKPGDPVDLEPRSDGTLLLRPVRSSNSEPAGRRATLDAAGLTAEQLERRVINLYLGGCERIEVVSRPAFRAGVAVMLDELPRRVSGLEIVEQSEDRRVFHDMIDPRGFDMARAFDRMYGVASALHRDVVAALAERDVKRLSGVTARHGDIDRLAWVVGKQQRLALDSVPDGEPGAKPQEILAFASATSLVQGIGANGVQLAESARPLIETAIDPRVLASAVEVGSAALNLCDEAARAFSKADLQAADSAMSKVAPLDQRIAELRAFASRTAASGMACGPCLGTSRFLESVQASLPMGTRLAHIATERALSSERTRS